MNEEREVYSMKGKGKRVLSGLLSLLTILTSMIQPVVTYAAEPEPPAYEAQYPSLETVREFLDVEEIVTAEDYEVEAGSGFDVKSDFSGLEINDEKVRVSFHEAKNEAGQDYDGNHADTYRAVYFVEPTSGHQSFLSMFRPPIFLASFLPFSVFRHPLFCQHQLLSDGRFLPFRKLLSCILFKSCRHYIHVPRFKENIVPYSDRRFWFR